MKIAVLSDIHDNIWNLAQTLDRLNDCDVLICCGDLCSPFIVPQLAQGFSGPIHIVFGNNDGDRFRITAQAQQFAHVTIHGEFGELTLDGCSLAIHHFEDVGKLIAMSGAFDVVCCGHNHVYRVEQVGKTLWLNPGEIMGRFGAPTAVVYDTIDRTATRIELAPPH